MCYECIEYIENTANRIKQDRVDPPLSLFANFVTRDFNERKKEEVGLTHTVKSSFKSCSAATGLSTRNLFLKAKLGGLCGINFLI